MLWFFKNPISGNSLNLNKIKKLEESHTQKNNSKFYKMLTSDTSNLRTWI